MSHWSHRSGARLQPWCCTISSWPRSSWCSLKEFRCCCTSSLSSTLDAGVRRRLWSSQRGVSADHHVLVYIESVVTTAGFKWVHGVLLITYMGSYLGGLNFSSCIMNSKDVAGSFTQSCPHFISFATLSCLSDKRFNSFGLLLCLCIFSFWGENRPKSWFCRKMMLFCKKFWLCSKVAYLGQ